ncbi:MAG: hypothetical protein KTR29_14130 [Rhodothermaceae bacterium]|nr:hypothetical protein [Rhodothermaceae bacterium]
MADLLIPILLGLLWWPAAIPGFLLLAALLWDPESVNPILFYFVWIVNFLVTFLTPSLVSYLLGYSLFHVAITFISTISFWLTPSLIGLLKEKLKRR